jgi:hypothetical protein
LDFTSAVNRFVNDTIDGSGLFYLINGTLDGTTVSTSTVESSPMGIVRIVGDVTISSANANFGYLTFAAGADLGITNSAALLNLGELTGAGELDIKGNDDQAAGDVTLVGAMTFANSGYTTFQIPIFFISSELGGQITLENKADATWVDGAGGEGFSGGGPGDDVFYNYGTFEGYADYFGLNVVNDGLMEPGAQTNTSLFPSPLFSFVDSLTGTGTIEIGPDKVEADAVVGGGQTFEFTSVSSGARDPALAIDRPDLFSGLITGFDQNGSTDDQIFINNGIWQYQDFVANSSGTGGSLVFSNGNAQAYLSLAGSYQPNGFHAVPPVPSDPGTTITYSG